MCLHDWRIRSGQAAATSAQTVPDHSDYAVLRQICQVHWKTTADNRRKGRVRVIRLHKVPDMSEQFFLFSGVRCCATSLPNLKCAYVDGIKTPSGYPFYLKVTYFFIYITYHNQSHPVKKKMHNNGSLPLIFTQILIENK